MLSDAPAMVVDLGAVGELLRRNEVQLFEQRDVAVGFVVALDARVAVPIPDAAEVAAQLDDADVLDSRLLQVRPAQQAPKPPPSTATSMSAEIGSRTNGGECGSVS